MPSRSNLVDVCPLAELPPGAMRKLELDDWEIGVLNCEGELLAIEDRCSHDSGVLLDGELDERGRAIECPRHGSWFDLRTGRPKNLPAYQSIETFLVAVGEDGMIRVEVD